MFYERFCKCHNPKLRKSKPSKKKRKSAAQSWLCPTCLTSISTAYCSACGEKTPGIRDLTLRGLLVQFLHAFSSVDQRLIRSFRSLITRPGELTVSFIQGQRVPFAGPFQLFLIANVLFFALQSLTNTNIVSTTLDSHLHNQDWSSLAAGLVNQHLETHQTTLALYTPIFNQTLLFYAKTLIVLMTIPFAGLVFIMFYRSQQLFVAHLVFSLYFYTFLLLLFCLSIMIAAVEFWLGGDGLNSPWMDNILSLLNLILCAVYIYQATGTVYGSKGLIRFSKVIVLTLAVAVILLGYRFLLFLLTLSIT